MQAHVRLIAALDKNIPCWLKTNQKPLRIDDSIGKFDLSLAHVVREAGGQITLADAYRRLSHPGRRDYRRLTVEKFLQMLRGVECTVIEFKDPETPIVRLSTCSDENMRARVQTSQPSAPGKIDPDAIQFFGRKNGFCERQAVAGH